MSELTGDILIADDEVFIREGLKEALQKPGFTINLAADGYQAREMLAARQYDLVFLDLRMPGPSGMELLAEIRERYPETQTILLTAHGTISTAVEAMRNGAYDFMTKPVDINHLRLLVDRALDRVELARENRKLHDQLENSDSLRKVVQRSPAMQAAVRTVKQVAMTDVPLLLRGETGSGKELFARTIHERSQRREGPFVAVNCGGFTEELFSSELFGHVRGAFTGAHADRPGRFALAEAGTLFLDEIGEVPLKNQVELLRALESREFHPVGDTQLRSADVRIIAATNRDLKAGIEQGIFREDLYYRLDVVPIDIPPLRSRPEDIPVLVEMFLDESCRAHNLPAKAMGPDTMDRLVSYNWPGNVRELRNMIQRLVVTTSGRAIAPTDLPDSIGEPSTDVGQFTIRLGSSLRDVETELIRQTLERVTSNRREVAALLGISVRSLQYKLKQYDIR